VRQFHSGVVLARTSSSVPAKPSHRRRADRSRSDDSLHHITPEFLLVVLSVFKLRCTVPLKRLFLVTASL